MAENGNDKPGIIRFRDHEMIVTPNRLKKAVRHAVAGERDPVLDAEAALVELSAQFGGWMEDEYATLDEARRLVHAEGSTAAARQKLFRAAHDIKGHGATFGFPTAADVAESLCRLIEHADPPQVTLAIIDKCVDAVRAIIRERERIDAERTAGELAEGVRALAGELIANRSGAKKRLAASQPLRAIAAPPLAANGDVSTADRGKV